MDILGTSELLKKFEQYVKAAERIDISVAWATPCAPLLTLCQYAKTNTIKVRVILGLDGNATHPSAIETLSECSELRIAESEKGIFHPKIYIFHFGKNKHIAWVGSANFTRSGFTNNEEIIAESSDSLKVISWFNKRWRGLKKNESDLKIEEYSRKWTPPIHGHGVQNQPRRRRYLTGDALKNALLEASWSDYVALIKERNDFWIQASEGGNPQFSVTGEAPSWIEIIDSGNMLMYRDSWRTISDRDAYMLLGLTVKAGDYGLLGGMKRATDANKIFINKKQENENTRAREAIFRAIRRILYIEANGTHENIVVIQNALNRITEIRGVGIGVATRLLALARPDMAISVNNASKDGLAEMTGMGHSAVTSPKNYSRLLEWLYGLEWYKSPPQNDPWELDLWNKRAALIDCFVYKP